MIRLAHVILAVLLLHCIFGISPAWGDLTADINKVLEDKLLAKAQVGIDIVRLGTSASDIAPVCEANSKLPLIPASNLKVITTSAALSRLGADFKFRTMLLWHNGDLVLMGDGDPTLGDAELLKKVGWSVDTVFKAWTSALVTRKIVSARDLLVDDSVFDGEFLHPNWPADQVQQHYVAEVGGLNLNVNCVDITVHPLSAGHIVNYTMDPMTAYVKIKNTCIGGDENTVKLSREPGTNNLTLRGKAKSSSDLGLITIHDPPMFAGAFLGETLKSGGVTLTGSVRRDRTARVAYAQAVKTNDPSWVLLAVHETPLLSVIARANKDSMNLYAECLCKRLGFAASGEGSWKSGTAAVAEYLTGLKISPQEFTLDDGCGLSKHNGISAHLMVGVLTADYFSSSAQDWMNCLAVAGEDGTLAERFRGTDLRGRVIAKTGFVNGVSALSGYLHAKDNHWYAFSILFNGIPDLSNSAAKTLQERIVRAVDQYAAARGVAMVPG